MHTTVITRKETSWPSWDGSRETYSDYRFKLEIKVEEDGQLFSSSRAVCLGMMESLPEGKRHKVKTWFRSGGPGGNYSWKEFLNHFDDQFEDTEAMLESAEILGRMRQGHHQTFDNFLKDFERQYDLCDENIWGPTGKIAMVHAAINEQLRETLVGRDLPIKLGYRAWVNKVGKIAIQLEALRKYKPRGSTQTKTWFVSGQGTIVPNLFNSASSQDSSVDNEGDTIMGGVNSLSGNPRHSKGNKPKPQKPRAPWKSAEEFKRLVDNGLCTRCSKSGHFAYKCRSFLPALPPKVKVSAMEEMEEESESGNEEP